MDEEFTPAKRTKFSRKKFRGKPRFGKNQESGESSTEKEGSKSDTNSSRRAKKPARTWSPMNYLLWLQGRREHSRSELHQKLVLKLREKELVDQHDPEQLLDRLSELNLQSDQRFLEGHVRQAVSSGRGPAWVKQKLYRHQLESSAVSEALSQVEDEQWEKEAYDLARRRFGVGPYPREQRMKAGNFLIRRGYSIDLSRRITSDAWPEEQMD